MCWGLCHSLVVPEHADPPTWTTTLRDDSSYATRDAMVVLRCYCTTPPASCHPMPYMQVLGRGVQLRPLLLCTYLELFRGVHWHLSHSLTASGTCVQCRAPSRLTQNQYPCSNQAKSSHISLSDSDCNSIVSSPVSTLHHARRFHRSTTHKRRLKQLSCASKLQLLYLDLLFIPLTTLPHPTSHTRQKRKVRQFLLVA